MEIENNIFNEKYRPKTLDELILSNDLRQKFQEYIDKKEIPNLLLHGNSGTGKSTLVQILLENLDCNTLVINSSLETGIDTIRDKVYNFVMTKSFYTWKIVVLNEVDRLSGNAFDSLKVLTEEFYKTCRFIFITNSFSKIPTFLLSRFSIYEFKFSNFEDVKKRILYILNNEKIKYTEKELDLLIKSTQGDLRQLINKIQKHTINGELKISKDILLEDNIQKVILALIKKGDNESLNKIRKLIDTTYNFDYISAYNYLYNNAEQLGTERTIGDIILSIAEYTYRDSFCLIKPINFCACCADLMRKK